VTSSPNTLALACVAAAGAARHDGEAQTVCMVDPVYTDSRLPDFVVHSSQEYAVLRENGCSYLTPLASFLPGGKIELYPAGAALPFFQSRIDSDVSELPQD
jgi:hypothetical protein